MRLESRSTVVVGSVHVTFIGVRHHSPACARLVRDTIRELRPAHVLIEGPVEMNDRLDELLLGHELPIAVFTSYRDTDTRHMSWAPLCEYSPEWVGLLEGREAGAAVRFIDLPAWHRAFAGTENRYADAERRYERATQRLCEEFSVDNIDTLWDHLFEMGGPDNLAERLATYFELVRGEEDASPGDLAREEYMADWIRAAVAEVTTRTEPHNSAGPPHIVVITGGFHRPALIRRIQQHDAPTTPVVDASQPSTSAGAPTELTVATQPGRSTTAGLSDPAAAAPDSARPGGGAARWEWPAVPAYPEQGVGGSYLVPFSFRRLDAFAGYQSGMPSPAYYQRLWEAGAEAAAEEITQAVVTRLRARGQGVSTASLIGARTLTIGLSRLRGHESPSRTDVLDGLAGTLITEALDRPLPWTGRGQLSAGTDPVVVEMVAAMSGGTVGRLHVATPHPPLVHDAVKELARCGIPDEGRFDIDLATEKGLDASRVLHRLRILGIPGFARVGGPAVGRAPELTEQWQIKPAEMRLPALIEAGSLGATCAEAAAARLGERFTDAGSDTGELAEVLFDATLCGLSELTGRIVTMVRGLIDSAGAPTGLGRLLAVTLGLWRHDRLFGTSQSPTLSVVIDAAVTRLLWLVEAMRGGPAPADDDLLKAIAAVRDAALHADSVLSVDRTDLAGVFQRCTAADRPPALRGASVGVVAMLAPQLGVDVARAVRLAGKPEILGDFLAGLFALAREELLEAADTETASGSMPLLTVLDELVGQFGEEDFLAALPALRLAFAWFPPRERAHIASRLLGMRGATGDSSALLRLHADAETLSRARSVELRVDRLLLEHGLTPELSETTDD